MSGDENSWRTPAFRQTVVAKINEAIQGRSGMPTTKISIERENRVFQKVKSKEEYLGFVARMILDIRQMNYCLSGAPNYCPIEPSEKKQKVSDGATQLEEWATTSRHLTQQDLFNPLTKVFEAEEPITVDQFFNFRDEIARKIDDIEEGQAPRFEKTWFENGTIVVVPADEWSEQWIRSQDSIRELWEGINLRIRGDEFKVTVFIPGPPSELETVLKRLEKQNPTIRTHGWVTDEAGLENKRTMAFDIPESSFRALEALEMKPYFGAGRVTFKVKKT